MSMEEGWALVCVELGRASFCVSLISLCEYNWYGLHGAASC